MKADADSETDQAIPSFEATEATATSAQEEERSTSMSGMYYPPVSVSNSVLL